VCRSAGKLTIIHRLKSKPNFRHRKLLTVGFGSTLHNLKLRVKLIVLVDESLAGNKLRESSESLLITKWLSKSEVPGNNLAPFCDSPRVCPTPWPMSPMKCVRTEPSCRLTPATSGTNPKVLTAMAWPKLETHSNRWRQESVEPKKNKEER